MSSFVRLRCQKGGWVGTSEVRVCVKNRIVLGALVFLGPLNIVFVDLKNDCGWTTANHFFVLIRASLDSFSSTSKLHQVN